ncbi:hypothetical protein [Alteromonas ponticola]|uniref:HEAT repeat domain-containing protein n=1 Tax=Alteromonas ponticola TaxID=2720613 RepID=A0ABX1R0W1_9ALTE|nr:hypothetical protein [Alteromonas ponticola]NMH59097.1 hypothetical protein [Alteromonas ponticola]
MVSRIMLLLILFTLVPVCAIEISEQELDTLQRFTSDSHKATTLATSSVTQNTRDPLLLSIWERSRKLKQLQTLTHPAASERDFVSTLLNSNEILTLRNPDHPQHLLTIVDIAREARATEYLWKVNAKRRQLHERWQSERWNWTDIANHTDKSDQAALISWLDNLHVNEISDVADNFYQHAEGNPFDSNHVLVKLALTSQNPALLQRLVEQPADQYSHMALQLLTEIEDTAAVSTYLHALKNSALESQALLMLAKHYAHYDEVQVTLVNALKSEKSKWHAAMAITVITEQNTAESLARHIDGHAGKANQLALSHLLGLNQ